MVRDVAIQIVIPIALGCISFFIGLRISDPSNIVVGISIVAALMCAMAVLLFQVRAEIRRENNALLVGDDVKLVDETFDDAMWAILVGFLIALYLVIVDAFGLFECCAVVLVGSWELSFPFCFFIAFSIPERYGESFKSSLRFRHYHRPHPMGRLEILWC